MWPPRDLIDVLLLLLCALGAVFAVLVVLGLIERLRNTQRWNEAHGDARQRAEWIKSLRRDAEAAARDGGTRSFE